MTLRELLDGGNEVSFVLCGRAVPKYLESHIFYYGDLQNKHGKDWKLLDRVMHGNTRALLDYDILHQAYLPRRMVWAITLDEKGA